MRSPIWETLKYQGRNMVWLARETKYRYSYVRAIACGHNRPSAEFRRRSARALGLPEHLLFLPSDFADRKSTATVAREEDSIPEVLAGG